MKTLVTRLVVTTIVATCVFAPTRAQAQEQVASKPRVDFRLTADLSTSLHAPLLTAARPTALRAPAVPRRRKMSTGARIAIGVGIGFGAAWALVGTNNCGNEAQCGAVSWGMIAGGGVIGYFAGR